MTVRSTAGTTLRISAAAPATYNAAGYAALTYTNIGEITDLGEFGREYAPIKHNPIDTRATVKLKGSFDEGQLALQLGLDTDDAGQILCKAALLSDNNYSFEVTAQNGDKYYFPALVMSFKTNFGSVDSVTSASMNVELTSSKLGVGVVEVLAV